MGYEQQWLGEKRRNSLKSMPCAAWEACLVDFHLGLKGD